MRHDLIETWIERNQLTDENFATLDEYTEFLNTALLCGLVPATPINIIVILAEKIAYNPLNSSVTSRGHCYETLIYLALKRTNIAEGELDIYLNVLEFLSHELFANDVVSYSQTELAEFFRRYRNEFNLPYSDSKVIGTLSSSRIFSANSLGEYAFANEYMFYFFVAKYLANHRHEESVREQISSIYNNLDVSENGYIGVFVVHHINDPVILREIARNLTELYSSYEEATLSKNETGFLEKNVSNLAKITMEEHNNSRRNRLLMLQNRDQIDEASEQEDGESSEQVSDDDFDVTEELSTIRKALKTSEVMGHILKSRTGSFPLADQREYYKQASALHMRIASRFISDFSSHETEFIEYFADRIAEFPNTETLDREKTYELAVRFYLDVNLGVYVACILRSTITLASQPILGVITEVCEKVATPLSRILHLHASMWLTKKVPVADFQDLYKSGNGFVKQLIRRLIASYCDLHEIDRKDKQRISALFTIDLRQMLVDKR